jgi:hypothetical protein
MRVEGLSHVREPLGHDAPLGEKDRWLMLAHDLQDDLSVLTEIGKVSQFVFDHDTPGGHIAR